MSQYDLLMYQVTWWIFTSHVNVNRKLETMRHATSCRSFGAASIFSSHIFAFKVSLSGWEDSVGKWLNPVHIPGFYTKQHEDPQKANFYSSFILNSTYVNVPVKTSEAFPFAHAGWVLHILVEVQRNHQCWWRKLVYFNSCSVNQQKNLIYLVCKFGKLGTIGFHYNVWFISRP